MKNAIRIILAMTTLFQRYFRILYHFLAPTELKESQSPSVCSFGPAFSESLNLHHCSSSRADPVLYLDLVLLGFWLKSHHMTQKHRRMQPFTNK